MMQESAEAKTVLRHCNGFLCSRHALSGGRDLSQPVEISVLCESVGDDANAVQESYPF